MGRVLDGVANKTHLKCSCRKAHRLRQPAAAQKSQFLVQRLRHRGPKLYTTAGTVGGGCLKRKRTRLSAMAASELARQSRKHVNELVQDF